MADGNRTRVRRLSGCCSAIELRPPRRLTYQGDKPLQDAFPFPPTGGLRHVSQTWRTGASGYGLLAIRLRGREGRDTISPSTLGGTEVETHGRELQNAVLAPRDTSGGRARTTLCCLRTRRFVEKRPQEPTDDGARGHACEA